MGCIYFETPVSGPSLSRPDLNPFYYAIWGALENKINASSHRNIVSLKNAIEGEQNKISEEFILNACKSFRKHVDTILEEMAALLCKFTLLCLSSYFIVYFFKSKLIFFFIIESIIKMREYFSISFSKLFNNSIWPIDGTLTGTTTPGHSGPVVMAIKEYLTLGALENKTYAWSHPNIGSLKNAKNRGARGVLVIVIGNGHGDTSLNPGRDWLHFT